MSKLRLVSKRRTGATIAGLAAGITLAGLALPWIVGDRVGDSGGATAISDSGGSVSTGGSFGDDGDGGAEATGGPAGGQATDEVDAPAVSGNAAATSPTTTATSSGPAGASSGPATPPTAGEIKLGVLLLDLAGVQGIGFQAPGASAEEEREAFDVYIGLVNDGGGINGRRIVPYYRAFDPLKNESMDAACVALAQDGRVFAAIAAPGYANEHTLCLTERFGIPTVSFGSEAEDWQARARGLLVTKQMSTHRMLRAVAQRAEQQGRLRGKTIGIVTSEAHSDLSATRDALEPALARLGYKVAHTAVLADFSADASRGAQQVPVEIVEMRRKNVDLVIFATNAIYFGIWANQAEGQQFRPLYIASDVGSASDDFAVQQAPASLKAIAYTGERVSEYRAKLPEAAADASCHQRYRERTGRSLDRNEEPGYHTTMRACGWVDVFTTAARRTGSSLTRASYVSALRSLGPWDFPYNGPGSIQPGKLGIADSVRTKEYRGSCRCWVPVDDFVPAAP